MTVASPIHMHREIRGNQSSRKQAGEAITTILSHGLILGHVTTSTHISNKTISLSLKCLVSEGQRQQGSKAARKQSGGGDRKCGKHTGQALGVRGGTTYRTEEPKVGKSGKNISQQLLEWESETPLLSKINLSNSWKTGLAKRS